MALALEIPPLEVDIERWRLKLFAKAIGETDPVYSDPAAALAAGYPDLPVPPSFLGNSIELDVADPLAWLIAIGADPTKTLHAEQAFTYHAMAFAGDRLMLKRRITDVYSKKGGALEFVVKQTDIWRGEDLLAVTHCSIVIQHPEHGA
jgi:hypothetical protein